MGDREDKKTQFKNLRGMVSKQKKRYQDGNYDLDLSCILPQKFRFKMFDQLSLTAICLPLEHIWKDIPTQPGWFVLYLENCNNC